MVQRLAVHKAWLRWLWSYNTNRFFPAFRTPINLHYKCPYLVLSLLTACQKMHQMQQECDGSALTSIGKEERHKPIKHQASSRLVANQFSYRHKVQMHWWKLKLCKDKGKHRGIVNERKSLNANAWSGCFASVLHIELCSVASMHAYCIRSVTP